MNRTLSIAALVLAASGLAACGGRDRGMVNSGICASFKTATAPAAGAQPLPAIDAAAPTDDCVKRWAYSLAGARDSADTVADAAVAACSAALGRWNQATLQQGPGAAPEGLSLATGQPTNPLAEHSIFAHSRATLYVEEARAGRCAPPPMANGVPAGTS